MSASLTIGGLAELVRSKNAGPFWQTIDIFFSNDENYRAVAENASLNTNAIARLYQVDANNVRIWYLPDIRVVKISFPRPTTQGGRNDRDMHAGQQHIPLTELALQPPEQVKPRWRGASHEVAAIAFPILGAVLVAVARTTAARWAALTYSVGITAMYVTSACYHRGRWNPSARRRFRRLDHSMILVGIAATYTPIAVVGLDPRSARILLGVVWPLALAGIAVQMLWLNAPRWLVAGLYVVIGWTALAFVPVLWHRLGVITFSLIVCGGVVYSVGARVYSTRRPDPIPAVFGFHEVFHALVLLAGLIFYVAIARVIVAG